MKKILSLCFFTALYGDNSSTGTFVENTPIPLRHQEQLLPRESELNKNNTQVIASKIQTIILLGPGEKPPLWVDPKALQGVKTYDLQIPGGTHNLSEELIPLYKDKDLAREDIYAIRKTIIRYYQSQGRPLVTVTIPDQDITEGTLTFVILESHLERVKAYGARWFSNEKIASNFKLQPGEKIDQDEILKDLQWVNKNPFHKSNVIYAPGKTPDTTIVEVVTEDRFPLRPYVGVDNTGLDAIGKNRFFAGITWGNAFWADQQLTYQYTASFNIHRFQSHTASYQIPFPWRHIFTVYGGYSSTRPKINVPKAAPGTFKSEGMGVQASGRYTIPLKPLYRVLQEVTLGFDFKRTNTTLFFSDEPIFGKLANLTQFLLGYSLGHEGRAAKTSLQIDLFLSPGKIVSDESVSDYNSLRPGARPRYFYGRLMWGEIFRLPKQCSLSFTLRGQAGTKPLLPSEQYGLGGYDTIRGYEERSYQADEAGNLNVEFRSPVFNIFRSKGVFEDKLQLIGFLDYGYGYNLKRPPGENKNEFLVSVGPGIRYMVGTYLNARLDWGVKLHTIPGDTSRSKLHFSVIGSY